MAEQTLSLLKVWRSFPIGASFAGFESLNCMISMLIWLRLCFFVHDDAELPIVGEAA
jgi:hypothetical protein